jgi:hypothetical protein
MIGGHIKIVMNYLSALRMPHYKKKSHHHDRRQDKERAEPNLIPDQIDGH